MNEILYRNVCRSLFEKHKLLFSFLLCVKILLGKRQVDSIVMRFLLTGSTSLKLRNPNPCYRDPKWLDFEGLSSMQCFECLDGRSLPGLPSDSQLSAEPDAERRFRLAARVDFCRIDQSSGSLATRTSSSSKNA